MDPSGLSIFLFGSKVFLKPCSFFLDKPDAKFVSLRGENKEKVVSVKPEMMSDNSVRLNNNQNTTILKYLSEGVCHIDIDGHITYSNHSAQRMLNLDNSNTIGRHYQTVFFGKDQESLNKEDEFCPIDFVLSVGEISHVNTETFKRKGGETGFLVEYICVPVKEEDEITGAVISFQDITERRDVEIEMAKARDEALIAAREKASFLANMSHEIRTPLSGIVGTADLLLNSKLEPEQRKYAEMLRKSTDLLTQIVNDVLDFSKIEAGKFEKEKIPLSIGEIVSETGDIFSSLVAEKNLGFRIEIAETVPENLLGDVKSIRQILNNFISNAIKFTETGEILVKVAPVRENSDSTRLRISVTDTGIGIDEAVCKRLFEPFTQADSSWTRKFGGTGLGLAICRQLVELSDGEIGVESRPGSGSVFWFECEFEKAEATETALFDENNMSDQTHRNTQIAPASVENLSTLIVEDNPINREITSAMLSQFGHRAKFAENGLEAVKACQKEDFDLILMDCHMPEMDGFEATRQIRQKEDTAKNSKIIAFTASVLSGEREKCFQAGMDDCLGKPFTKEDLEAILTKHFGIHNGRLNLDLRGNMIHHSLSKIIEPEMLKSLLEIEANKERGFIFEILNVFLNHAEEKNNELKAAIKERDRTAVRTTGHNLKGSSANVGLTRISQLYEDLEQNAGRAGWPKISSIFEEIKNVFEDTKKIILDTGP
jgi:PAS domain S-box-containing protein